MSEFCPKCKKLNSCDVDGSACWCLSYPTLHRIVEALGEEPDIDNSCMCESCFKEELKQKIDLYVERFKQGTIYNIAPKIPGISDKPIQGIDFYIEDGKWVFTSWNHLKRGYCCGSGCKHCPYPKEKVKQH